MQKRDFKDQFINNFLYARNKKLNEYTNYKCSLSNFTNIY